jgi:hypothetical protein
MKTMQQNLSNEGSLASPKNYRYQQNRTRTYLVIFFFTLATLIFSIISILNIYLLTQLSSAVQNGEIVRILRGLGRLIDNLNMVSAYIYIISAIVFLFWIYRASNNAHSLYPQKNFKYTPGWCVGSYFIPFMNVVWPWFAMDEIWLSSSNHKSSLISVWWLTFLFMNILDNVGSHQTPIHTISDMQIYFVCSVLTQICGIVSALTAIVIVRKINEYQTHSSQK